MNTSLGVEDVLRKRKLTKHTFNIIVRAMIAENSVPVEDSEPLSPQECEAIYAKVQPLLHTLYDHCQSLGLQKPLAADLQDMAVEFGYRTIDPGTLLTIIANLELPNVIEAANSSASAIRNAPWPMVITQWHLLALMGTPMNEAMEKLYATQS